MTYREAVAWLYGQQLHGIRLGLETMERLCAGLHIPLSPAEGAPVFLHVAGTNGKGSVCAMLDAILRAGGVRTGLYTSPHLVTFRERIRLDGEMISERDVADGLSVVCELIEAWEPRPTFFEIVTALALRWLAEQRAQVVVLETGLGGKLDATNVVTPGVSVLTPIGFDHQTYLGDTLAAIAGEKAGIIKPEVPVVSAPQSGEVEVVFRTTAAAQGCELTFVAGSLADARVGLSGSHQARNAALALAALDAARIPVPAAAIAAGLATVEWPGRFQRVGARIVLDGAHNPAAAAALARTWREVFGERKATLILGVMRDKDVRGVCAALAPIAARVLAVRVDNARSCTAEELAAIASAAIAGASIEPAACLGAALTVAEAHPEPILIAGSLFLVGEALVALGLAGSEAERSEQ